MKILVINAGSSSLKFQLLDMETEKVIAKGNCERLGLAGATISYKHGQIEQKFDGAKDHKDAIQKVLKILTDKEYGVIESVEEIDAVGHRVLHGGEIYTEPVLVSEQVLKNLDEFVPLGPLHMPANLAGIKVCQNDMPDKPQVAVFDTAFHSTMPQKAYMYAIDYDDAKKFHIRKYGFHGISHSYIAWKVSQVLGKPLDKTNVVVAHLGNGSSVTAIKNGKSVDTTAGFTPLEGVVMGTRAGNVDPTVVQFLCHKKNMSVDQVIEYLNRKSGVLGISGVDSDMRAVEDSALEGNERCSLAMDMASYSAKKYIASFLGILNGADAIVFTGGVGENSAVIREGAVGSMDSFGVVLDKERNESAVRGGGVQLISTDDSKVKIYVIPTDEELMIARATKEVVEKL